MLGTEGPSMLQSMGLQRVGHNLVTKQQNVKKHVNLHSVD